MHSSRHARACAARVLDAAAEAEAPRTGDCIRLLVSAETRNTDGREDWHN